MFSASKISSFILSCGWRINLTKKKEKKERKESRKITGKHNDEC
jgi:hypothetical protein